jgi:hypothetical protein
MASDKSSRQPLDINSILACRTETASALYDHALRLIELQKRLRTTLPSPLNDHVTVANCKKGTLIIYTDSAAWAARLRFRVPEMLKSINEAPQEIPLQAIRIKVRPPDAKQLLPADKLSISDDTARLLQRMAETISDPDLRASLLRLSRHNTT